MVLAQALACEPEIVIADEPTASLDALTQSSFLALLRELKSQLGISVLMISHSAQVQASLADRVMIMKEGRIVEEGRFSAIRECVSTRTQREFGLNASAADAIETSLEPAVEESVAR